MCRQGGMCRQGCAGRSKAGLAWVGPGCLCATRAAREDMDFIFQQLHPTFCVWVCAGLISPRHPVTRWGENFTPPVSRNFAMGFNEALA